MNLFTPVTGVRLEAVEWLGEGRGMRNFRGALGAAVATAVGALAALAVLPPVVPAAWLSDTVASDGPLEVTLDVDFAPENLPRTERAPVAFAIAGTMDTTNGSYPSPLRQLVLEFDRDSAIDGTGLPRCENGYRDVRRSLDEMKAACEDAIVGGGRVDVGVVFVEEAAFGAGELVVFNGRAKDRRTTLYAVAQITRPVPVTIVMPIEIKKRRQGRIGTEAIVSVPEFAHGAGFITDFRLRLDRRLGGRETTNGVISLQCPDGKFTVGVRAKFENESLIRDELPQQCRAGARLAK
ncbi:MAG TPA: hypothetical protein VFI03_08715 [Solirubrobacterales bacterium]|nr:hypothetical protein [Solirubrobacterales bacterium]